MKSTWRVKCNSNHVCVNGPVNFFSLFINVNHIPTGRNSGGQIRHSDLLKVEDPRPPHSPKFWRRGCYQHQSWHKYFSRPEPTMGRPWIVGRRSTDYALGAVRRIGFANLTARILPSETAMARRKCAVKGHTAAPSGPDSCAFGWASGSCGSPDRQGSFKKPGPTVRWAASAGSGASRANRRRTPPRTFGIPDSALHRGVCEAIQTREGSRSG